MQNPAIDGTPAGSAVTLTEACKAVGKLVNRASIAGETIVIYRHGVPAAAIVPLAELQKIQQHDAAA